MGHRERQQDTIPGPVLSGPPRADAQLRQRVGSTQRDVGHRNHL